MRRPDATGYGLSWIFEPLAASGHATRRELTMKVANHLWDLASRGVSSMLTLKRTLPRRGQSLRGFRE